MSSIRDLVQLQEIDAALATRRTQLAEIQRRLEDTADVDDLNAQREQLVTGIATLEREHRAAEAEVQDARAHLGDVEGKLYGGSVKNPKELMSMQQDADMIRGQLTRSEDAALAVLGRLEQQRTALAAVENQLSVARQAHAELEAELGAQRTALDGEVADLDGRRQGVTAKIPAVDLRLYASQYGAKQGRAVAKVERTLCQGCRVNLPAIVVQRVRGAQNLIQCPSCGRILYFE